MTRAAGHRPGADGVMTDGDAVVNGGGGVPRRIRATAVARSSSRIPVSPRPYSISERTVSTVSASSALLSGR